MLSYNKGINEYKNFLVTEDEFNPNYLGKCETIMCLGNGYMCIRSATEERYLNETRDTFIAGTYNKFDEHEVTELPNVADVIGMNILLNGIPLDLTYGTVSDYSRTLNLKDGLLTRSFIWDTKETGRVSFSFKRTVSLADLHALGQSVSITPLDKEVSVSILSGINGQVTNSGAAHFSEGDKRLYDNTFMSAVFTTTESKINFVINTFHKFSNATPKQLIIMDRRQIKMKYEFTVTPNNEVAFDKITTFHTSRDKDSESLSLDELKDKAINHIKRYQTVGFEGLFNDSKAKYHELWDNYDITVSTKEEYDQLAIRFAIYHLTVMTPAHDNRMNIGAKGMSGEGYKGHVFWDTEIFMLPYFIYQNPKVAKSLMEYRYFCLEGAREKARLNDCEGAMYPWECAYITDGEVTPLWGAADIVTGLPTKIWSGIIEIHITCDVAFGVWQYFKATNDIEYMNNYGYEILLDTAKFWNSRLEWKEERGRYEICDVVGPDEYKEHVDNNAFTNYMAHWNIKLAIDICDELQKTNKPLWDKLSKKLDMERVYKGFVDKLSKIYLPQPNENGIVPQTDTYLSLKEIDLTKYKTAKDIGTMFNEYSLDQVNEIQVSKQADTLVLFYLLEDLFPTDIKSKNFDYYEARTLHDSSLSYSTHSILANDIGRTDMAYDFFKKAATIDLGDNPKSSDHGIHAASIGGIYQCIVNGFGGVRLVGDKLRITPKLPDNWDKLSYFLYWHGTRLKITIDKTTLIVDNISGDAISFVSFDKEYTVDQGGSQTVTLA